MLTYKGGQKVGKGTYWDLRNGCRIYVDKEGVLPGGDASTFIRMPAWGVLLLGPIIGILYVVLFPLIGIVVVLMFAARRVVEGIINEAGYSFHWKPKNAYLTGKKKEKPKEKHDKK